MARTHALGICPIRRWSREWEAASRPTLHQLATRLEDGPKLAPLRLRCRNRGSVGSATVLQLVS
ncbi:MAG: hypothetical protein R2867_18365 [Caldilineaceae bacterium]